MSPHIEKTDLNMTVYEAKTLPCVAESSENMWDFADYKADLVVVDIGTNDYILALNSPTDERFIETYVNFVSDFIQYHKNVNNNPEVLLVCGPMTSRQCGNVEIVSEQLSETYGESNIGFLNVELETFPFLHGCLFHPTVADHQVMAEIVEVEARKLMGW